MKDNIKNRDTMKDLRKRSDNELETLYNQYNLIISKFKGASKIGQDIGKYQKDYHHAKIMRARVLTVMNQRRHERMFRNGNAKGAMK